VLTARSRTSRQWHRCSTIRRSPVPASCRRSSRT
jgi:hypothetical protein